MTDSSTTDGASRVSNPRMPEVASRMSILRQRPSDMTSRGSISRQRISSRVSLIADKIVRPISRFIPDTQLSTLITNPDTRLGKLAVEHDTSRVKEYFFDRHPIVFGSVINYYRTGELHVPIDVCGVVVRRELAYWQIDPDKSVQSCCWLHYCERLNDHKSLGQTFDAAVEQEQQESAMIDSAKGWKRTRLQIWRILSRPNTSKLAFGYMFVTIVFTMISIADVCVETLPGFTHTVTIPECHDKNGQPMYIARAHPQLMKVMIACVVFFSLDILIRLATAPKLLRQLLSVTVICEILSLSPFYISIILDKTCYPGDGLFRRVFEFLHILRLCRIFFALGQFKPFRVLVLAVKASTYELLVLLVFYIAAMMFFGFFVYYAESYLQPKRIPSGSPITSIPLGIWYSLETVTTVGYGDMYPVTWGGYIVGVVCQLVGVILLSLTIPVVSSNFSRFYAYAKTRDPRKRYNRQRLRKLRDEETRRMSQHHDDEKEVEQRTVDIEHEVMQT